MSCSSFTVEFWSVLIISNYQDRGCVLLHQFHKSKFPRLRKPLRQKLLEKIAVSNFATSIENFNNLMSRSVGQIMTITSTCDLETSFLSFTCTLLSWRILRKEICFKVWSLKDNHFHFLKINAFFLVLQRQSLLLSHNKFCLQNDIQVLGRLSLSLSQKNIFSRVREWYGSDCVCKHWRAAGITFLLWRTIQKINKVSF